MIENSWIFPTVQSIHLVGIAMLVGSIVMIDLRRLEYVLLTHTVAEVNQRFSYFRRIGLAVMLTTGPVLFISNIPRYTQNPAFLFKMAVLLIALFFSTVERQGKFGAIVSIALWTVVVLGGRAIADFDL
jgi:putative copper export protein